MKSALAVALGVAMWSSLPMAGAKAGSSDTFCSGLKKAVTVQINGAAATFIRSYEPGAEETSLPLGLASTAFVYDNALAVIALVACGDIPAAKPIGEALSRAVRKDRSFDDGRIRNAYRAGAVGEGPPNLPGWWDAQAKLWAEDPAQDGTSTGNVAWGALALLTLHQATQDSRYLADAKRLVDWIIASTSNGNEGFFGGFHGYDPQQARLTWMSTEHNVDIYAAGQWLFRLTGEPRYAAAAAQARRFVASAFQQNHFLLGTKPDGSPADGAMLALDVQLWPWMAIPDAPAWRTALEFAESNLAVDGGFDFNGDRDGLWVEGTAQAALAYRISGDRGASDRLLSGLKADRTASGLLNATRRGKVSTGLSIDPTGTVPDFFYFCRPHLGATAWAALADMRWNPFTGGKVQ
jgi:hypothetical protein